jgi:hypothetical protein
VIDCVGILQPASRIAYFQAVHARWRRQLSKCRKALLVRRTAGGLFEIKTITLYLPLAFCA